MADSTTTAVCAPISWALSWGSSPAMPRGFYWMQLQALAATKFSGSRPEVTQAVSSQLGYARHCLIATINSPLNLSASSWLEQAKDKLLSLETFPPGPACEITISG